MQKQTSSPIVAIFTNPAGFQDSSLAVFSESIEEGPYVMDEGAAQTDTPHFPEQDVPLSQGMS